MSIGTLAPGSFDNKEAVLSWTIHLAREYPLKATIAVAGIMLSCIAAYYALGSCVASFVVGITIVASLADFLFPVKYILTSHSAACMMLLKKTEISWSNVKRCYIDETGVKLSPLDRKSRLEAFRGVYLRFADNKEQVIDAVRALRGIK